MSVTRKNAERIVLETFIRFIRDNLKTTEDGTEISVVSQFPDNTKELKNVTLSVSFTRYSPIKRGLGSLNVVVDDGEYGTKKNYKGQGYDGNLSVLIFASSNHHRLEVCGLLSSLFLDYSESSSGIPLHDPEPIQSHIRYRDNDIETIFVEDIEKGLYRAAFRVVFMVEIYDEATESDVINAVEFVATPVLTKRIPPVATAGNYQSITVSATPTVVVLDGSESYGQGVGIELYEWTQKSGKSVILQNADESIAQFSVDTTNITFDTKLVFELKVTDTNGVESTSKTVVVCKI